MRIFPFVAVADDGVHILEQGTPLMQVIPFRREHSSPRAAIRAERSDERAARVATERAISAGAGWYRRHARAVR